MADREVKDRTWPIERSKTERGLQKEQEQNVIGRQFVTVSIEGKDRT